MRFNLDNYETVETRLAKFWEKYPNGRIATSVFHYDNDKVVFAAAVFTDAGDQHPRATGYAEELRDASPVNRTSHVENAETSAIGRALANFVFQSKTAPRPSREEMAKVARSEAKPAVPTQDFVTKFREACNSKGINPEDVAKQAGVDLGALTEADHPKLRDAWKTFTAPPAPAKEVADADKFIEQVKQAFPTAETVAETPQIKDPDSPASPNQISKIRAMLNAQGFGPMNEKIEACAEIVHRPIKKMEQLTKGEASTIINSLESRVG